MTDAPQNILAEESVLGAMMTTRQAVSVVLGHSGLRAEDFYRDRHREVFAAIEALHGEGVDVDAITVLDRLERTGRLSAAGGRDVVVGLPGCVPVPGNVGHYADIVTENARLRRLLAMGQAIQEAVRKREGSPDELVRQAQELLDTTLPRRPDADWNPERLADLAFELLNEGSEAIMEWPFAALTRKTMGGLRRGQYVLLAGLTAHGKSSFLDQLLDGAAKAGRRTRLYMNEMTPSERVLRLLQRRTGVPYERLANRKLHAGEGERVMDELNRGVPYGVTYCPGWSATEIANHARLHRWDVWAVDMLHEIAYEDERELASNSGTLKAASQLMDSLLIVTCHLNEGRAGKARRDVPVVGDIKGSGTLKYQADIVSFVWLEQDEETGDPADHGMIRLAKVRNASPHGSSTVRVHLNSRMAFELQAPPAKAADEFPPPG